ncbi:nuclear body protein SP140-like protein isoform X1 [Myotis daubentonii]|uniref:nuclear body protein SP140-like protein isoform X1 n=1 Tax=Myotis daubentonii TaxID=98922 RepID=UPI002873C7F7|nr:nuclear body protein SP140-like protein isoform X1 [Myotis daubentonii]XP_059559471.1 nuclear body protein SP140-like protein isoform X1 [Myotis daubentonii]
MFSTVQHKETTSHEIFLTHFKKNKAEIVNAITKPFPFFESLRDHSLITEELYNDSQEACKDLVPVGRVVYHILCHLEKMFDWSLLQALFSRVHLKEYPDLIQVHRSFKNVIQDKHFSWESDREETHEMSSTQPSCERGAELYTHESLAQSCAVGLMDMQKTISSCPPEMNEGGQQARPARDQVPEIIGVLFLCAVISSESNGQEVPPEAQKSAPRCGPGEECEDGQPQPAEHLASEFRAPVS